LSWIEREENERFADQIGDIFTDRSYTRTVPVDGDRLSTFLSIPSHE